MKIWNTDTFWGRVEEKSDKKGISLGVLAEKIGMSSRTFYNLRNINDYPKKDGAVEKLAKALGTTVDYLMQGIESEDQLTPDEERLLLYFSALSDEDKKTVLGLLRTMSCSN